MRKLVMRIVSCAMCAALLITAVSATGWGNLEQWNLKNTSNLTESTSGRKLIIMNTFFTFSSNQINTLEHNVESSFWEGLSI